MILIVSEDKDHSTNDVVEWLLHFNCPFIRISDATPIALKSLRISPESTAYEVVILGRSLKSTEIRAIWYRRGAFRLSPPKLELGDLPQTIARRITYQLEQDVYCANEFLLYLQAGAGINDQMNRNVNKLHLLDCAREVGLLVPDTMVTGNRESLLQFASVHGVLANKNLTPGVDVFDDSFALQCGTTQMTTEEIAQLPMEFAPALFQQYVEKWIELRIFYLHGQCYSSAIFSQFDEKTKVDFRNYNTEKPNRTPPFELPNDIAAKLHTLMVGQGLSSGSIDMLVSPDLAYYFLEVNPVGQFWQVSHPCNYGLEKIIAEHLRDGYRNN